MNNEKPNWSVEKSFLSIRDIGRLLLTELKEALDRWDEKYADSVNSPDDNS